ncbi:MAG: helix-turn-helix domain-containing protein [Phycisphaerae bacterium]|nr:helix-turn-helix domain-containing protein [Phycisphaerae bacterium]
MLLDDILDRSLRFEFRSVGTASLDKGHSTGWRVVPRLMISHAYQGRERLFLRNAKPLLIQTGETILLPAGIRHRVDVVGAQETRCWAHVNYFILENLDLFSLFHIPLVVDKKPSRRIGELIRNHQARDQSSGQPGVLLCIAREKDFGFQLLEIMAPLCTPKANVDTQLKNLTRLEGVMEFMQHNFHRQISRDELAEKASLSPTQFHKVFKTATGKSPVKYLEEIRLRHAQQLLISTHRKISDIARECGYSDPYVFSKFFKRACGCSPLTYRNSMADITSPEPE